MLSIFVFTVSAAASHFLLLCFASLVCCLSCLLSSLYVLSAIAPESCGGIVITPNPAPVQPKQLARPQQGFAAQQGFVLSFLLHRF